MSGLLEESLVADSQAARGLEEQAQIGGERFEQDLERSTSREEGFGALVGTVAGRELTKKSQTAPTQKPAVKPTASSVTPGSSISRSSPSPASDPDQHSTLVGSLLKRLYGGLFNNQPPPVQGGL